MTIARENLQPAYILSARITAVDPESMMMELRTEVGEKFLGHVPIPSLYLHPFDGEGVHVMPEIGTFVWVCLPSEGDARAVPLVFKPPTGNGGSHKSNRPFMNPGDIILRTRDRNGIEVRRGGVIGIKSTPLAQMFFLPRTNEIVTLAENWRLETLGGHLRWTTERGEEDPDGRKGTKLDLSVKEFADQPHPVARLQVGGQVDDEGDQVLDLRVYQDSTIDEEEDGPLRESVSVTMSRSGDLELTTYQGSPANPEDDLETSVKVTANASGEIKINIPASGQVAIFNDESQTEGVILGETFLTELQKTLIEIQAGFAIMGLPTTNIAQLVSQITASLSQPKGTGPLISVHMRTD